MKLPFLRSKENLALHIEPRVSQQDRLVLKLLLDKVKTPRMVVAEIGSFLGNGSTQTILEIVKEMNGTFYCIDTWKGNQNVRWHLKLAEEYSIFNTFLHYVKVGGEMILLKQ